MSSFFGLRPVRGGLHAKSARSGDAVVAGPPPRRRLTRSRETGSIVAVGARLLDRTVDSSAGRRVAVTVVDGSVHEGLWHRRRPHPGIAARLYSLSLGQALRASAQRMRRPDRTRDR